MRFLGIGIRGTSSSTRSSASTLFWSYYFIAPIICRFGYNGWHTKCAQSNLLLKMWWVKNMLNYEVIYSLSFGLISSCVDLVIIFCHVLLKITILEVASMAALYFSTLRVKLISGDIYHIFTICKSLSYDVLKLIRDKSLLLMSLFYLFWWIVSKNPVVVCGDEYIGCLFPCGCGCCLFWRWCPALIDCEWALSDVLLCACRPPVFLVRRFLLQQGFL